MRTITPRERVLKALRHEEPDIVPYHLGFTQPALRKFEAYCGTKDVDSFAGNHLAIFSVRRMAPWTEVRPGFWRDSFGVLWNRTVDPDIGVVEEYPLRDRTFDGYSFPDPMTAVFYDRLPAFAEANRGRFRLVNHGFAMFERAWSLREMGQLLTDMMEDPGWVDELFDRILEFGFGVVQRVTAHDVDGFLFADDWAYQQGIIMGPRLWRRFIKPRMAELFRAVKKSGKAVFLHCCGKVQELFPDLIEMGLEVFNPLQPEVMDPFEMKRLFGRHLSFYGGMSVQRVLPHGTPQEVKDTARRLIDHVGKGGGYILAPSHEMTGDIPVENMVALLEVVKGQ